MRLKVTEHEIQRAILDYLSARRVFHWRNNTGAMAKEYGGKRYFMRFGAKGSPDIFALKDGKLYGLEVKSATGKPNPDQLLFGENMTKNGAVYAIVRSLDDVAKLL